MQTIISFLPRDGGGSKCGYCKQRTTFLNDGSWAYNLTCGDYQRLVDRGFRRSGKYVYKMDMKMTCCPAYTIKCDVLNFKLSRSQRKVLKVMTKFLTVRPDAGGMSTAGAAVASSGTTATATDTTTAAAADADAAAATTDSGAERGGEAAASSAVKSSPALARKKSDHVPRSGAGADLDRAPCRKAKELRKEKKAQKTAAKQLASAGSNVEEDAVMQAESAAAAAVPGGASSAASSGSTPKPLEDFLAEALSSKEPVHRLTTEVIPADDRNARFKETQEESYQLYRKYQIAIHGDTPSKLTASKWYEFLVASPLQVENAGGGHRYGVFHRHYVLDGKLIAVGVMDILPNALSSVYVYYDPDLPQLSLGTYTALQEIAYTRLLQRSLPELRWYYMGFYIHDCVKMNYKGNFVPSLLLCPERFTWVPIEECRPKLDASKYARLDPLGDDQPQVERPPSWDDIKDVPIYLPSSGKSIDYEDFERRYGDDERSLVERYWSLVGNDLAKRMILYLQ